MNNIIIDALDWQVIYDNEYLLIDKTTNTTYPLDLVAKMEFNIFTEPLDDELLSGLFDNDYCGEQVTDDEIIYYWFKERPCTLHIIGDDE